MIPNPPAQRPVRRTVTEYAYEAIRDAILDGVLAQGANIQENELTSWLGVSRSPIREALRRLAQQGFVEIAPQSYTRVAVPNPQLSSEAVQTSGVLLSGLVTAVIPELTEATQRSIDAGLERCLAAATSKELPELRRNMQDVVQILSAINPNQMLARICAEQMPLIRFTLADSLHESEVDWELLTDSLTQLRNAISNHAIGAAVAAIYRLHHINPGPDTTPVKG